MYFDIYIYIYIYINFLMCLILSIFLSVFSVNSHNILGVESSPKILSVNNVKHKCLLMSFLMLHFLHQFQFA